MLSDPWGICLEGMTSSHFAPLTAQQVGWFGICTRTELMRPNSNLMKATLTGALGGLFFGFDTVVISGVIDALVKLYGLSPAGQGIYGGHRADRYGGWSAGRGRVGQRLGGRETLRMTAVLYIVSAFGGAWRGTGRRSCCSALLADWGLGHRRFWGRYILPSLLRPSGEGDWSGHSSSTWFRHVAAYSSNYLIRTLHLGATEWRWQVGVAAFRRPAS